ncbi:MAG: OmpA family protein [Desulfovibrio sp.]|jgi:chemotaxis protein MotB|nr:OmpA family protein [Desulfovibrio sp.]
MHDDGARAAAAGGNFAEWSVPWSDLMMIMFMVFAVLFIYSGAKERLTREPQASPAETKAPTDPMKAFLGELDAPVKDGKAFLDAAGQPVNETYYQSDNLGISVVRETDRQVRVFMRGDLFFSSGGDALSGNSGQYLARIAELLRVSTGAVLVVGHTADGETATPEESLALSAKRASSVAQYFIRTANLDPKRFLVTGRGSFQPEVPATAEDAEKRNRRVEVLVLTDI